MKLDAQCGICNSWSWCGRGCKHAPRSAPVEAPKITVTVKRPPPAMVAEMLKVGLPILTEAAKQVGRPPSGKVRVTMLLDPDVIAKFKAAGEKGWQARMNEALRKATP